MRKRLLGISVIFVLFCGLCAAEENNSSSERMRIVRNDILCIKEYLQRFYVVNGFYPAELPVEGITDPWGNRYVYYRGFFFSDGQRIPYLVISYGSDGKKGGEGECADFTSADDEFETD